MDYSGRTRRTMGEALQTAGLSPEELTFVSGETSSPKAAMVVPPSKENPLRNPRKASAIRPSLSREISEVFSDSTVSMTFRLPADLPEQLIRISAERKVHRQAPSSQQDIVAEALREWLATHGS